MILISQENRANTAVEAVTSYRFKSAFGVRKLLAPFVCGSLLPRPQNGETTGAHDHVHDHVNVHVDVRVIVVVVGF